MSAISTITLETLTAENATYTPMGISPTGVAKFVDRSTGIPVGFPQITVSLREPTKGSRAYKIVGKLVIPVLDEATASTSPNSAIAGPKKAFDMIGQFEFVFPERSTFNQRALAHGQLAELLNSNDMIVNMVTNLEALY